MRQQSAKNVLMRDGTGLRLPGDRADELVSSGAAKRFISNTVYKALRLGIEVKDLNTQDADGALKKWIQVARERKTASAHKAEAKKKQRKEQQKKEAAENYAAQTVLNSD